MTLAKELNNTIVCMVPTENAQYYALKNISDTFRIIAALKAEVKPRQSSLIKQHNEAKSPRVEKAEIPTLAKEFIIVCPQTVVAPNKSRPPPPTITYTTKRQYVSNYIPKPPQSETPVANTRFREISYTVTQEALLSAIAMSSMTVTPQILAARRFPMKLLCEMAGAVIDSSGEVLEYRKLITRDKYCIICGKAMGNEIGRLSQGLKGRVEGTNIIYLI